MRRSMRRVLITIGLASAPIAGMAATSGSAHACVQCAVDGNSCIINPEPNQGYLHCQMQTPKGGGTPVCYNWGFPCQ